MLLHKGNKSVILGKHNLKMSHSFIGCLMLFNIFLKISSKRYHLNSTLHIWNFIPKSDDTILVYLWLLTRRLTLIVLIPLSLFLW